MFNHKINYSFVAVSTFLAILANYHYPFASLWLLFLLPAMGIITRFPSWRTVPLVIMSVTAIALAMEFKIRRGYIPVEVQIRESVTFIVGFIVFLYVAFYKIKTTKLLRELERIALTDPLTKAYNRRYFEMYMENTFPSVKSSNTTFTIIVLDIDHFKKINDTYGHYAGDYVLKKLSRLIQRVIGEMDILVRMGGEEFAIILPTSTLDEGQQLAERVRKIMERVKFDFKGKRIKITVSLGVSQYNGESTIHLVMEKADKALYQAKDRGRNQVVVDR